MAPPWLAGCCLNECCVKTLALFLLWSLAAAWAWGAEGPPPPSSAAPARHVARQYALTSANDFPQRDPQDWRLLASNDGGTTWTTLDTRKGEIFAERHERRVFRLDNPQAFGLYRLQIDRVRNPLTADAVQLAEIEPLGALPGERSPLPIFADAIAANGDNPPLESAFQAFDGQVETKWLQRITGGSGALASWIQWRYLDQSRLVITNLSELRWLRERAKEAYPVQIEAVVVGPGSAPGRLWVLDATEAAEISGVADASRLVPGQHVLLAGKSDWAEQRPGIGELTVKLQGPVAAREPRAISPGQAFAPEADFHWVSVEGTVQFPTAAGSRRGFELLAQDHTLTVRVLGDVPATELPAQGSRVRVSGVCAGVLEEMGERVAGTLWLAGKAAISEVAVTGLAAPARTSSGLPDRPGDDASPLTDIRQILHLSPEEQARGPSAKVQGVVTETFFGYIQEGEAGLEMRYRPGALRALPGLGARVEVEGRVTSGDARGPGLEVRQFRILGEGKLPEPARPAWAQLVGGRMNGCWIQVDAVVRATDGSHLLLYQEGRQMMATIRSAAVSEVKRLVDASVQLRGVCVNATDDRNIVQGIQLIVPSLNFVRVREVAPDLTTLPVCSVSNLYRLATLDEVNHRVKVRGTLTCQEGRKCFVQDASGSLLAMAKAEVMLTEISRYSRWIFWQTSDDEGGSRPAEVFQPGDEVEVTGFPETRGFAPILTEAQVHKVGQATPPAPVVTTAQALALGRLDATLVTLEGTVLGVENMASHVLLQMQSDRRVFRASLGGNPSRAPRIAAGSLVRLTGVCQMEPATHAELGRSPSAFALLLRTPADIAVLQSPPWWTVERVLLLTGALLLGLLGTVVWIRMLHRRVDERTRQLQREVADHEQTEARLAEETRLVQREIEERRRVQAEVEKIHRQLLVSSHLAGMAEVATSVLHNVGNVLNGANVLTSSIASQVRRSEARGVSQLAALLAEHREDLGRFLSEGDKAQLVCGHLDRLGSHLTKEQAQLAEKISLLSESLQHIKEIVAMQQDHARVYGVTETLSLANTLEDAIQMCSGGLAQSGLKILRDYEELPRVTLDRHKVLQILFNLLENARQACEAGGEPEPQITVRLRRNGQERLEIRVRDNGIGIPPENLPKIFTQGFSTRKGGHGFGLHSSVLAAQDMGGTLNVNSDGPGRGATFTLELPLTPPEPTPTLRPVQPATPECSYL